MGDVSMRVEVAALAEAIYDLVADMPRMGEWSPECERVEWTGGASGPAVGVGFVGHNRIGWHRWSTHGRVTTAERGSEFAFDVRSLFDLPVALWSYRFETTAGGACLVTESTTDRRGALIRMAGRLATGVSDRAERNRKTMTTTLDRLRVTAEGQAPSRATPTA
ncbi:MAG: SRPBCC family protein [Candidatus Dormibacter sp.]